MLLFILSSLIGWSLVQPQHTAPSLTCYTCDGHHHQIPACLASHTSCSKNEICQVNYAGGATKMKCRNSKECTHQTAHSNRQCSTGGAVVHETCQVCCSNQTCVEHFKTMALNTAQHIELGVHCPADCTSENLSMCVTSGHRCATSQFCKVTLDEISGHAHGQCIDNGDITQCRAEATAAACDAGLDRCTAGCCTDDACVASSLGAKTTSYWSFLNGECVDQLAGDQCHDVDSTQHLCNDRLAVRVCPSTCGLCSLYNTTICQDMLAHAGCHSLVLTDNICSDSNVARDICPRTCGMCDEVIDQKLQAVLQESQVTATGAPSTQAVTPATLLLPSCAELAMLDCHLLVNICPLVSCNHVCDSCFYSATTPQGVSITEPNTSPTTPQPSTSPTIPQPRTSPTTPQPRTSPTTPQPSTSPTTPQTSTSPTTPQPSTSPTTPQPSTSPTTPQTSTSPTTPQATITPTRPQVCEDTLDTVLPGLLCSAVENVCFDAQVVNCRKYCGLCTAAAVNQTTAGSASGSVHTTTITTPPSASPTHVSTQSATKRTTVAPVSTQGASVPTTTAPMTTQTATKLTAPVTTKPTTAPVTTKPTTTAPVTTKPTTTAPVTTNPTTTVPMTTKPTTTVPVTTETVSKPTAATPRPTTPSPLPTTATPVTTPIRTTPASVSTHVTQTPAPEPTTGTPTPAPFTTTAAPPPCLDSLVCTDDSCRNPVLVGFCPKYCGVC